MVVVEQLIPPEPRARFCYSGPEATLLLPDGLPEVRFVLDSCPWGDQLYHVKVDRIVLGGRLARISMFGRDIHLSECSRFLALTGSRSQFHVFDLVRRVFWASFDGNVQIEAVSSTAIAFRRYVSHGLGAKPGDLETASLERAVWSPIAPGIA